MHTHLSLLVLAAICVPGDVDHRADLLEGVTTIAAPGTPGPLALVSPGAFAVVVGESGGGTVEPVVAAAEWERGRVVAFGHTGYFGSGAIETADTGRLLVNAVRWTGRGSPTVAVVRHEALTALLVDAGLEAVTITADDVPDALGDVDVLCAPAERLGDADQRADVADFVRGGGGLVTSSLGWGWQQVHREQSLVDDHPGNRLLAPAGVVWVGGYLKPTADGGFDAAAAPPRGCHASVALGVLKGRGRRPRTVAGRRAESKQAAATLLRAARGVPDDDAFLLPVLREYRAGQRPGGTVSAESPLGLKQALERVLLALEIDELADAEVDDITAHPSAAWFPGPVPADAPRVERTVTIDPVRPGWHGTGLYAVAGEPLEVTVGGDALPEGLALRIGAHKDELWHKDTWSRVPRITRTVSLAAGTTRVASAFGGLVYVVVPDRAASDAGSFDVDIHGAVESPLFRLGETSVDAWPRIRARPAPWAELATEKVIITVPSEMIRELDDPRPVLEFWDRVMDACADLATRPRERRRPERYVSDVQISHGYMHAGYPIMYGLDQAAAAVDVEALRAGRWGFFHEMGHNHQHRDWTFGGTVEVTCNLFSLYVLETVCGIEGGGHAAVEPEAMRQSMVEHLAAGADFQTWKRKPFLALIMYAQLKDAFGWDAYRRVFAEYRDLPDDERPKNDAEKRDQWLVRFSRTVGRNLGPFFETWGVPTSEGARASIADLPDWMPTDSP